MTEFDPISELINYFEENGWPLDINDNKLSDRASYEDHPNQQGYFVVEIERHRPILETRYRRGLSMSAFQTYWMRYAVHPRTKIVKELSEKMGEISIDMYGIVAEELEDGICLSRVAKKCTKNGREKCTTLASWFIHINNLLFDFFFSHRDPSG